MEQTKKIKKDGKMCSQSTTKKRKKLASHFVPTYGGRVEIGLPCKTSQGVHSNIKDFKGGPKEVQYTLRSTIEH